ncbi:MAG: hypothetical protein ABJC79_03530, partial [Acidimicrobiia bacterium]
TPTESRGDGPGHADMVEALAEAHLMHRILVATVLAVPIGAVIGALLLAGVVSIAGRPVATSAAMGAGIGVLAGLFFGVWAGFVASANELDHADLESAAASQRTGSL